ncbi:hypothetical protein PR048_005144 [Dryococelus australis]|uniref:Uncharacterized protein n=1 Tax=Dryococelus australis TaxID=614101 RepID=A0ABQ9I7D6_9NEOP|nr:hypothetical protein PR048_005144 [Dryococelus australis]
MTGQRDITRDLNVSQKWGHITKKLLPLFEGPYVMSKVTNTNCYELKHPNTGKIVGKFNFSALGTYEKPLTSV